MSTTPPRVLRLITRLNVGGPARQALLLTRALAEDYPTVLAAGRPSAAEGELADEAVTVHHLPLVREPDLVADVRAAREVRRLLAAGSFELIHTHMAKAGAIGRMAARSLPRRPVTVHTFHGHVLDSYFRPPVQRAFIEVERRLATSTDVLVAVSPEIRDALLDLRIGRPDQYRVIPLGLDLAPFLARAEPSGELRARIGISPEVPLVGVAGRLVPIKDHRTLFRAVAQLDGVHVAVVGDGELRHELEHDAAALGMAERTHFTGWWTDMAAAFSDFDLVALTSLNEGTPVALIEALAAGRPVVATRVGGVPSVVTDGVNGILVAPRAAGPLADAIRRVLADQALGARFGAEGRRVGGRFGQDRLVADVRSLYQEVLARRGVATRHPARPARPDTRPLRVLALTTFPPEAAATRHRLLQLERPLAERGITLDFDPFLDSATFASLYDRAAWARTTAGIGRATVRRLSSLGRARQADVVLVQREAMILGPPVVEWATTMLGDCPLVLDLDDPTYVSYDSPTYGWAARLLKWPGKTDSLIRRASVVVCGSPLIADHVRSLGTPTVLQPTVVDVGRFSPDAARAPGPPLVGWVGSHSTYPYLRSVLPALEAVGRSRTFRLRVVGADEEHIAVPGVEVENRPWRLSNEVTDFQTLDVGLYPVAGDGWAAAKSGLKAVQFMAVGVPFVASPQVGWVGEEGVTHLTARTGEEWASAVGRLLDDTELRRRMGTAGRDHAVRHYTVEQAADTMAATLRAAIRDRRAGRGATSTR